MLYNVFFFFKQKTAYEMRISDWSSDVCSSDLSVLVKRMKATVRLRRLALFAAAAVPIALAAVQSGAAVFNPKTFTLGNGLQEVLVENHRVPAAVQMVLYRVGPADEPPGEAGTAHFLEHLMVKGTRPGTPGDLSKMHRKRGMGGK